MSFFGSFFGSDQRHDIRRANKQANAALDTGYKAATVSNDQAIAGFDPYKQTGEQANQFYANALGLNGADARNEAQGVITSDPLFTGKLAADQNKLLAYMNARGDAGGGRAYVAGQRVLADDYGDVLNRYATLGSQGLQATGAQGNALINKGNLDFGYGATKAGNAINAGNAIAGTRNMGINNLLGVIGTGIQGYNALYNGGGRPQAVR